MGKRIVIIGAGPTGIGAARRLKQLGHDNWHVYEKNDHAGGLAASFKDQAGFTWDIGGHVIFSHYEPFDRFIDEVLGKDYLEHQRECWIRCLDSWVPYPFQNNIRYLPGEALVECLLGLARVEGKQVDRSNFGRWISTVFGEGIAKYFMVPYNQKVWAAPPEQMSAEWIADRISVVDFERVLRNVILQKDDVSWGPNRTFRFPLQGGTGEIWRRFAETMPDRISLGTEVVRIDTQGKQIHLADGRSDTYDALISTMPIPQLLERLTPGRPELNSPAGKLLSNVGHIVGLGIARPVETTKCWMYVMDHKVPFFRVTYFHHYSPNNVPDGDVGAYHSLMCDVSVSDYRPVATETLIEDCIAGCIDSGLLDQADRERIVDRWTIQIPRSYPIPSLHRDDGLADIQPELEKMGILSRGRFGAWRYEVGNMDHSFMQGFQAVGKILTGEDEEVFNS